MNALNADTKVIFKEEIRMETRTRVNKRTFEVVLSEEEGLILRTLLNLNRIGVEKKLMSDKAYWEDLISYEDAITKGTAMCECIMNMVDGE